MSGYGHNPRVKFTPELWEKWQRRREVDEHTLKLREGIETMRSLLAARDTLVAWEKR